MTNKKCLYKIIQTNCLNGIECKSNFPGQYRLHYGPLPENYVKKYTLDNINELFEAFNSRKFSGIWLAQHFFTGKRTYENLFDWILSYNIAKEYDYHTMNWKKFVDIVVFIDYKEIPMNVYTFKDLTEQLSVDEFIDFCNDNNILLQNFKKTKENK